MLELWQCGAVYPDLQASEEAYQAVIALLEQTPSSEDEFLCGARVVVKGASQVGVGVVVLTNRRLEPLKFEALFGAGEALVLSAPSVALLYDYCRLEPRPERVPVVEPLIVENGANA